MDLEIDKERKINMDDKATLAEMDKKLDTSRKELAAKQSESDAQTVEINELKEVVARQLRQIAELEEELSRTRDELARLKFSTSQRLQELEDSLSAKDSKLSLAIENEATIKQEISLISEEKQDLLNMTIELKEKLAAKEKERTTLTSQISKMAKDVEQLQGSYQSCSEQNRSLQRQYEVTKQEAEEIKPRLERFQSELSSKTSQLVEAAKLQQTTEKETEKRVEEAVTELTRSFETRVSELTASLSESKSMNDDLKSRLADYEAELEESRVKQISVYAGENCYHLYVAKLAYDPILLETEDSLSPESSPNKSCDRSGADSALSATDKLTEITVNAGDYVFVSGELSEEGFYEAHLLDGRAGWVPSNVLEPLYEFDLHGFVVANGSQEEEEEVNGDTRAANMSSFDSTMFNDSSLLPSTPRAQAPYPRNLVLERQFANSILIGWESPEGKNTWLLFCYSLGF